jgi:hypothetical protein
MAFCLHGVSQTDDDIYVMINAYWQNLHFEIQEGRPKIGLGLWIPICPVLAILGTRFATARTGISSGSPIHCCLGSSKWHDN